MIEIIKEFLALFSKTSNSLLNRIRQMVSPQEEDEVIAKTIEIIIKLIEQSSKLLPKIIKKVYKNGSNETIQSMIKQGFKQEAIEQSLKSIIHQKAIQSIVD